MTDLTDALRARITAEGPLRLDAWMAVCNAHYYATRDPFGAAGDFTTAPEISQIFGEMVGGWIGDLWLRAGSPPLRLVELGPGRGTLMADALRVAGRAPGFGERVALALVETSPVLRRAQAERLPATWHDSLDDVPDDRPLIIIANEFFDALPVRQGLGDGSERAVTIAGDGFAATSIPAPGLAAGETCEPGLALAATIGERLCRRGGAALIIDYGYGDGQAGDTLQALHRHDRADPFADPGQADLTAHVDFAALAAAAGPVRIRGPVAQRVWLARLGIEARAAALSARATRPQAAQIAAALVRLTAPTQMGVLFKAMALSAPQWPVPAGFDA
jgi:NADH dehydrogenase [ubiquinone] 1 alpha subcomplex assembly factor 7